MKPPGLTHEVPRLIHESPGVAHENLRGKVCGGMIADKGERSCFPILGMATLRGGGGFRKSGKCRTYFFKSEKD